MPISRSDCATGAYSGRCSLRLDRVDVDLASARPGRAARGRSPRRCCVLPQTTPFGNASKNVAISLFTASVLLSYSCTNSVTTPPGFRCSFDQLEELARVEHRRALHPRIERVRRDRVELLASSSAGSAARRRSARAPSGCRRRRSCARRSRSRRPRGTSGSISAIVSCSTAGIDRHRAGRDAGAAADDQHRLRVRRNQRRQVAEHALQAHVLRLARRLHLAGVVIVAARRSSSRDTATDAFQPSPT